MVTHSFNDKLFVVKMNLHSECCDKPSNANRRVGSS